MPSEIGLINVPNINVAAVAFTRPNDTTAYAGNDSISNNTTAGSVTANKVDLADLPNSPVNLTEILLDTSDTGVSGATIRMHLFGQDPTLLTGVGAGDNAAFSQKRAGWFGSFSGTMRGFSDGGKGVLVPDEGPFRLAFLGGPAGKTLWWVLQALTAFTPVAQSTWTPRFKGWQGRILG